MQATTTFSLCMASGSITASRRGVPGETAPPYYVFSHGMLDPWFKRALSAQAFQEEALLVLAEYRVLRGARAVLFTCEEERRPRANPSGTTYRRARGDLRNAAPPGDAAAPGRSVSRQIARTRGTPFWLFLGRIHEKKAATCCSDAYASAPPHRRQHSRLVMAGPCADAAYLRELQQRARDLGPPARSCGPAWCKAT